MTYSRVYHIPCTICGSSDAVTVFEDGHGFCFSCEHVYQPGEITVVKPVEVAKAPSPTTPINFTYPYRNLDKATLDKFKVRFANVKGHNCVIYPVSSDAYKVRRLDTKEFWVEGKYSQANPFGMDIFDAGSAKAITICAGENDAMAVYQMLGGYPVITPKNGEPSAAKDLGRAKVREYINSFDKIYICLDNDEAGREATDEVARLFDPNKVYIVKLNKYKDAHEYLEKYEGKEFTRVWWAAQRYRPKGIISSFDEVFAVLDKDDAPSIASYPFPTIEKMTLGIRPAEVNVVTAKSGIGKTEILRAVEYHILQTTDLNIGVIHLEEREKRAIQGLAGYALQRPVHRRDSGVSAEEVKEAYKKAVKRDDRVYYYQHFGSQDLDVIIDVVRNIVAAFGCKVVFLDHITMLVTGFDGDDERRKLDYLSTRFAMLARELDFTLFLVSHVNDNGQTRGSRNIENIADLWLHIDRDKEAADERTRNTIKTVIKKNRPASETGPAGILFYDKDKGIVTETEQMEADGGSPTEQVDRPILLEEQDFYAVQDMDEQHQPDRGEHSTPKEPVV